MTAGLSLQQSDAHGLTVTVGGALFGLALAAALAAGGFAEAARDHLRATDGVVLALVVGWAAAGVLALVNPSTRRLGRMVVAGAALGALVYAGVRAADTEHGDVANAARLVSTLAYPWLVALSIHILITLPSGRLDTRGRNVAVGTNYGLATVVGLVFWIGIGHIPILAGAGIWAAAALLAVPSAHRAYRSAAGDDRRRLQWLGCGAAAAGEVALVAGALRLFIGAPRPAGAVAAAGTLLLAGAVAATTSRRLTDRVDRVLVGSVSAAVVATVVVAMSVVIVIGLGRSPTGTDREVLGLSLAAAAVAAAGYVPMRRRLTDTVNRLVYGERNPPDEVLRTFGTRLTRAIPMDELLLQLAEALRKTLALTSAEIFTGSGEFFERTASVPDRGVRVLSIGERERGVAARVGVSGTAWAAVWLPALLDGRPSAQLRVAPIVHTGELLGLIVVERPADADGFTDEDDRVLTELSRQTGLALHNEQLGSALQASLDEVRHQADELRASRTRVVSAADAERRKIERNIHDGAQQHLVALAVNLRLAKDAIAGDPAGATAMLEQLAVEVRETIHELRDLAHGIYPPLLMDAGLPDALRAAASRSPLPVSVDTTGIGRYSAEVEAAVYFCCLEALQNAAKHAPGSTVALRVHEDDGGLLFDVVDDGPGFDSQVATDGHGFVNMSDRLGAIGGTVRWASSPGSGVAVHGALPL